MGSILARNAESYSRTERIDKNQWRQKEIVKIQQRLNATLPLAEAPQEPILQVWLDRVFRRIVWGLHSKTEKQAQKVQRIRALQTERGETERMSEKPLAIWTQSK